LRLVFLWEAPQLGWRKVFTVPQPKTSVYANPGSSQLDQAQSYRRKLGRMEKRTGGTPMTWIEEKLLHEAELCATRCLFCGEFGHRIPACPENQQELEHVMAKESQLVGRKASDRWIDLVLFVAGPVLGALLVSVMRG
jgi:hypothetical protein